MPNTPKLNLPYPSGAVGIPPDVPGDLRALALAVDGLITVADLTNYLTLSAGVGYDSSPGLNQMLAFGPLRVLSVSLFSGAGISGSNLVATVNAGSRPAAPVFAGATVYDAGGTTQGIAYVSTNGALGLTSFSPDFGNDGKYNALRATFVYAASS